MREYSLGHSLTKTSDDIILRYHKSSTFHSSYIAYFVVYGFKILCEISKGTFAIWPKTLNPYSTKYAFYWLLFLYVIYNSIRFSETGLKASIHQEDTVLLV